MVCKWLIRKEIEKSADLVTGEFDQIWSRGRWARRDGSAEFEETAGRIAESTWVGCDAVA
jgi:hypothetical protein